MGASRHTPLRALNSGSIVLSLLLTCFALAAVLALGVEAAAAGRGPRLAGMPPLAVYVHARGFTLLGADEALPDAAFARIPCPGGACRAADSYDYDGLTSRLARVKERWPRQDTLYLLADSTVPMDVLESTVDASTADRRGRLDLPRLLFPDVRIVRSVQR